VERGKGGFQKKEKPNPEGKRGAGIMSMTGDKLVLHPSNISTEPFE
jgi:hypothetical protein